MKINSRLQNEPAEFLGFEILFSVRANLIVLFFKYFRNGVEYTVFISAGC